MLGMILFSVFLGLTAFYFIDTSKHSESEDAYGESGTELDLK